MATQESVVPVVTRKVRAIVFANFPGQYFHTKVRPRLEGCNVEVVKVVEGEVRRGSLLNVSNADILIAMSDLLTGPQRLHARDAAKRNNLRYIGLTKHMNWNDVLGRIEVAPDPKVVPIRGAVRPLAKELTAAELEALNTPPSSEGPPPSISDLEGLIGLYEEENKELYEAKKSFDEKLKQREDRLIVFAEELEKNKKENATLEGRLKDQIRIRAEVEDELRQTKSALDALAHQLREERAKPRESVVSGKSDAKEPALSPGSAAAHKAHNTRLKNDLEVSRIAQAEMSRELESLKLKFERLSKEKGISSEPKEIKVLVGKEDMLSIATAVRDVIKGSPSGYRALLELAEKYNIDIKSILELVG